MYKYNLKNDPELARERHNAQNREWYKRNKDKVIEQHRKYRATVRMYKQNGIWEFMKGFKETQIEGCVLLLEEQHDLATELKELKRLKKELKQRGMTL